MTYTARAIDPLAPAVELTELADFLAVDCTDPVLKIVATMATSMAVDFLQSELVQRRRVVIYQQWPTIGACTRGLSPSSCRAVSDIVLPYAQLISVESVAVNGEATTDYTINDTVPASIRIQSASAGDGINPAVAVSYTAGCGQYVADVPQQIQYGIMQLAAFLYEHRGACDAMDAIKKSGAFSILYPYRQQVVTL